MIGRARRWLRSVFLRRRLEREMQEEMAEHLDRATARLIARGLPPDEARHEALREFGSVRFIQERARDARGGRWVEGLAADGRFALRHFTRTPVTTLTMFVVLSAGIALATLLFSAVHSLATQPPSGISSAEDLVRIRGSRGRDGLGFRATTEREVRQFGALTEHFRAVAVWTSGYVPLVVPGDAEPLPQNAAVTFVSPGYFPVLGVRPVLGPGLPAIGEGDASSAAVAVIGHATWEHLFARDPSVIGRTVMLRDLSVTIVGVAPERFDGVSAFHDRVRLWLPLAARHALLPGATAWSAAARLRPGVEPREATAAVRNVVRNVAALDDTLRALEPSGDVVPLLALNADPEFERDVGRVVVLVGLLALLVLLVTCTNVSALLMGLATARRQEIAVRLSLGASRGRLLRQLLTESVTLALAAGVTALAVVSLALRVATRLMPAIPFDMRLTWPATTFTFGVALAVGLVFGLAPALHGTRAALAGALRDSAATVAGGRARLQRALVVAQITFTQPLIVLVAAVLLMVLGELKPHRQTEHGDRLVSIRVRARAASFDESPAAVAAREELQAAVRRLATRLAAMPDVEAAVVEWPGASSLGSYAVHPADRVPGARDGVLRLSGERVAPGYFAMLGIAVRRGREFAPDEVAPSTPSRTDEGVVIGADVARRLWGSADPVGRRLRATSDTTPGARTLTVVGVIDDPKAAARRAGEEIRVYLPPDTTRVSPLLLVRTAGIAAPLLPTIRDVVRETAPGTVAEVRTLAELQDEALRYRRVAASWISAAGAIALLLSAIGLYAVVAFAARQRTREIAVRMAVGAPGGRIVRLFVGDGVRLGLVGLALGLPVGLLGLRALMATQSDFPPFPTGAVAAIAAGGVIATATLAAWLPARRAASVDPASTLRAE